MEVGSSLESGYIGKVWVRCSLGGSRYRPFLRGQQEVRWLAEKIECI